MWLVPLVTLGAVSLITFTIGLVTTLLAWTPPRATGADLWFPLVLAVAGAAGMWWIVRLTPER